MSEYDPNLNPDSELRTPPEAGWSLTETGCRSPRIKEIIQAHLAETSIRNCDDGGNVIPFPERKEPPQEAA